MAAEKLADIGLVRFSRGSRPVGAGFVVDDRNIVTCAHVVNASIGRPLNAAERPDTVGLVAVRRERQWIPVEVTLAEWIPLTEDKRGDVAVLEMTAGRPEGVSAVPLRRPHPTVDHRFSVQGFPGGTLIWASGLIRARSIIGQEWVQLEDDKPTGRAVTEGFSGAPIWDTEMNAVVGMAIAKDAAAPAAKIAAMLPITLLADYWPPLADLLPSRLALDPKFDTYWDPRSRGVESAHVPGMYFAGRRRALTELVAWLTDRPDPGGNLRVVTAGPGSGKSAVLARLVTASDPGYRHRYETNWDADDPVRNMRIGAIDVAVHAKDLDDVQIMQSLADGIDCTANDVDALVAALDAHGQPVTFIVDGLDESSDARRAAGMLCKLADAAADLGVRLLVGSRPGPQNKLLTALGTSTRNPALDLDEETYLDQADLAVYVRRRLMQVGVNHETRPAPPTPYRGRENLARQVAEAVADRAYPSFLIAALTAVGLVRSGHVVDVDKDGWNEFPRTVSRAMGDYMERFPGKDGNRVEDLLRPLGYSFGDGLPPDQLWAGLATGLAGPGRTYTVVDVRWLLDTAADYLLEATADTGVGADTGPAYRLYHQALIDHLRELDVARGVSLEEPVYQLLLDSVPRHPRGDADWEHSHPYIRTHISEHAAATRHLGDLVEDLGFLVAADPAALAASLRRSHTITSPAARTYRTAAHLLADPRDRLFQLQLHAARLGETTLARQLDALAAGAWPRLAWTHEPRQTPHYTLGLHTGIVTAVAVGELDGRPIVVSGSRDTVRVWDPVTGDPVGAPLTGNTGEVDAVAFGELEGRPVVVSGGRDTTVRVWDLVTGDPVGAPLTGHTGTVMSVAVGQLEGRPIVVSGSTDDTVRVWDLATGDPVGDPLTGHTGPVWSVAFGELEGRPVVVSGSTDDTVRVWDLATGDPVGDPLTGHTGPVWSVAFGELEGRPVVVSGSRDTTVRVWDLATGDPVGAPLTGHRGWIMSVAFGELEGRPVVVSGSRDTTVRVWDLATGDPVGAPLTGHTRDVTSVAFGKLEGRPVVVSGGFDATVRVWDLATGDPVGAPLTGHRGWIMSVAAGELEGRPVVVSGGSDATVRVWDLITGDPVGDPLTGHTGTVWSVAVGELEGRPVVVSGGSEKTLRVWDLITGDPVGNPLTGHTSSVRSVAVGELEGRPIVVSGGRDNRVRVCDLVTGDPVGDPLTGHTDTVMDTVTSVAVGALDGRLVVASGSTDKTVRVWDLITGDPVGDPLTGHTGPVTSVALGQLEGRPIVVSAGEDKTVRVWDLVTGDPVGDPLTGHTDSVNAVALGQLDGRPIVVSGSSDTTVRLWDLATVGSNSSVIRLGAGVLSVMKPMNNVAVVGHHVGLTAIRI